jgi:hypothetical protein
MRHTTYTILVATREAINGAFPESQYPPFTRTAETIKFLHGAVTGLRSFKRHNEAGIIDDVIAGIKRDGLKYLQAKINEVDNMRNAVSAKVEELNG